MASFRKLNGRWQAQVARRGIRKSKLFDTKAEAKDWAARQEYMILKGEGEYGPGTIGDLFDRYARTVSPGKRGARWEQIRLEAFQRDRLAKIQAKDVRAGDFADWRDRRLKEVSPGSVIREMNLMSAVMTVACKEWGILPRNPMFDVSKPPTPRHRERRVSPAEFEAMQKAAGTPILRRVFLAFEFAIETGMRAGEIAGLEAQDVKGRVAHLSITKNGDPRDVPLSSRASEILGEVGGSFGVTTRQIDANFRRLKKLAKVTDLTFHDSRHEAVSRLSKKLDVLALARMIGHRDIKMLQVYYLEAAEDVAERLD